MGQRAGKSIEWASHTWNPVKGRCPNSENCEYCYMHELYRRFKRLDHEPRLDEKDLEWKAPRGAFVFVGSRLDLFLTDFDWIRRVIMRAFEQPGSIFAFLTKFPLKYQNFDFPPNAILGTTYDGLTQTKSNVGLLRTFAPRYCPIFVSFGPLMGQPPKGIVSWNREAFVDWIIVEADSRRGAEKPPDTWAESLINEARECKIPIWLKDNYKYRGSSIKERPRVTECLSVERRRRCG